MLHSFIGFLFDVITCKLQWNKKDAKVRDRIILFSLAMLSLVSLIIINAENNV